MSTPHSRSVPLSPSMGGLFGALTGCLGGGMVWSTVPSQSLPTALTIAAAVVVLAAVGWFGTERLMRAASSWEESSK